MSTDMVVQVDPEIAARIGTLAACYGLPPEEVAGLLIERAISDGVDLMLFEDEEG